MMNVYCVIVIKLYKKHCMTTSLLIEVLPSNRLCFVFRHNFILYWNFVELLIGFSRSILMAGTYIKRLQ
jgi:hypothetical protein